VAAAVGHFDGEVIKRIEAWPLGEFSVRVNCDGELVSIDFDEALGISSRAESANPKTLQAIANFLDSSSLNSGLRKSLDFESDGADWTNAVAAAQEEERKVKCHTFRSPTDEATAYLTKSYHLCFVADVTGIKRRSILGCSISERRHSRPRSSSRDRPRRPGAVTSKQCASARLSISNGAGDWNAPDLPSQRFATGSVNSLTIFCASEVIERPRPAQRRAPKCS